MCVVGFFFFPFWQKFASGQEGHWSCLKEVSELCMLVDSCLIGLTHLLIMSRGKQEKKRPLLVKGSAVLSCLHGSGEEGLFGFHFA